MIYQDEYYTIPGLVELIRNNPVFFRFFVFFILEWMVFGFMVVLGVRFLGKGLFERENKAQKAYQKGLAYFFLTGALVQGVYLLELTNRFFTGWRIFNNHWDYAFDTIMLWDYFIIYWVCLLLSGAALTYPVERYMLKRRPYIAIVAAASTPIPPLLRAAEYALGDAIQAGNVLHLAFTILWVVVDTLIVVICVFVPVLYVRMYRAAPKKSKLRRKCIEVVIGYGCYILALVFMRFTYMAIPDPPPLGYSGIVLDPWFYVLVVPVMHFMAQILITTGFSREY